MSRWLAYCLILLAVVGAPISSIASVAAQTGQDEVTPPPTEPIWFVLNPEGESNGTFFDVHLEAGEDMSLTAEIGNGSSTPVKALIYAADAYSDVNGGFALRDRDAPHTGVTTWLDFEPQTREFGAREGIKKTFTVSVPEGTAPGQYITGLAVETAESRQISGGSPLRQTIRLVTAVFITVPGPVAPGFTVSELAVDAGQDVTTITGVITNTGNVRVRPEGTIALTDAAGTIVASVPLQMGSVYAHDTTSFVVPLPAPISEGTYQADVQLNDPDTGSTATLPAVAITVAESTAPEPLVISNVVLSPMPSTGDVVFVQVQTTVTNTGSAVAGGEVSVQVFRDGEQIDDRVLASSVAIQSGDTVVDQPYIPATGTWESGSYTFQVTLTTTDPVSGELGVVGTFSSDQIIVIP